MADELLERFILSKTLSKSSTPSETFLSVLSISADGCGYGARRGTGRTEAKAVEVSWLVGRERSYKRSGWGRQMLMERGQGGGLLGGDEACVAEAG